MTDKELLEAAARACGYVFSYGATPLIRCYEPEFPDKQYNIWNPITDDGDALRLAVKLNLRVWIDSDIVYWGDGRFTSLRVRDNEDPYAATRRAIVRAAAEIGAKHD